MKLPHKTIERKLLKKYKKIIAVDEVGMGCLAGPVVVCAVIFSRDFFKRSHKNLHGLRESKSLLPHQREKFVSELLKIKNPPDGRAGFNYRISYCFPKTIDRINIYQAARRAMKRAILECAKAPFAHLLVGKFKNSKFKIENSRTMVLVDGPHRISGLNIEQMAIIKGDQKVFSIACASILAKVYRDKMMARYAKKYPGYGFEKHKGYGTKFHQAQLIELGPSAIHRRSFAPVAELL